MTLPTELQASERTRRLSLWRHLQSEGGPDAVSPGLLRDLRIYGGAAGIWVDRATTATPEAPDGITVALLHTGTRYPDDLSESALIYHVPVTRRGRRDTAETAATLAAAQAGLPVFVITATKGNSARRDVRLSQIRAFSDELQSFFVTFDYVQSAPITVSPAGGFVLIDDNAQAVQSTVSRYGRTGFRFGVASRYGSRCAVCAIDSMALLDASHLADISRGGTNDARNGLMLCANHHRAFDRYMFAFEPATTVVHYPKAGPAAADLGITRPDLQHLPVRPDPIALAWRWNEWLRVNKARA